MQAYVFSPDEGLPSTVLADLKAVRNRCRLVARGDDRDRARVTLEEFPHDRSAFLTLMNGGEIKSKRIVKKYRIGARGSIYEIPVEAE